MDDTVAMQDTNPRAEDAAGANTACDRFAVLKEGSTAFTQSSNPQQVCT